MSEKNHRVSRRQFLNYTLTGVGGFHGSRYADANGSFLQLILCLKRVQIKIWSLYLMKAN